jgi:Cu-Zn family superoxide dismutase
MSQIMPKGTSKIACMAAGIAFAALSFAAPAPAAAADAGKKVVIHAIDANGIGKELGTLTLTDTQGGLRIAPDLAGLPAGVHGMHVHQNADCGAAEKDNAMTAGLKAGGHFDPGATGMHEGPFGEGHLGDLPYLAVNQKGKARTAVVAPRLKLADVVGHAIVIHAGSDNYSDTPAPLGGGGARIACGVVE